MADTPDTATEVPPVELPPSKTSVPGDGERGKMADILRQNRPVEFEAPAAQEPVEPVEPVESTSTVADTEAQPEEVNPDSRTVEPAPDTEAAVETATDPPADYLEALQELDSDEREAVLGAFQQWMDSLGAETAATPEGVEQEPKQPVPPAPTEEQVASAQQQELQRLQEAAQSQVALELTDDDLMSGGTTGEKVAQYVQSTLARDRGQQMQQLIGTALPIMGQIAETIVVGMLAEQQNPDLEGATEELVEAAGRLRRDHADMPHQELYRKVVETARKDRKTASALQKLQGKGNGIDARPKASPASAAASATAGPTAHNPQADVPKEPIQQTLARFKKRYAATQTQ